MQPGANRYRVRSYAASAPQPAQMSRLVPVVATVVALAILVAVVGYGVHLARLPRVADRTVPAALDMRLHNVPQAIAGGSGWRVIWWDSGEPQVETFDNRPDAAKRWALVRYLSGYAVLCAPGEACQAQSVTTANAVTRKGK